MKQILPALIFGGILFLQACSTMSQRVAPQKEDKDAEEFTPPDLTKLPGPGIAFQEKRTVSFDQQQVFFSNEFNSARMNDVRIVNDSTFHISILPENSPINRSPWFAFKVWSPQSKNIRVTIDYGSTTHRYIPKFLKGKNGQWKEIKPVSTANNRTQVSFRVPVGRDTTWVSGQPIFNKDSIVNWLEGLDKAGKINLSVVGKSTLGQPMYGYHTATINSKRAVIILGGQHPPEYTGFQAQIAFTNFLLSDDPRAVRFRQFFQIVGVPWINPDGSNLGHWRHNVAGVDLNRDWGTFLQKETQAARDYILSFSKNQGTKFIFSLDFHTTFEDILYPNILGPNHKTHVPGLMDDWIQRWNALLGDKKVPVRASSPNGKVSKSWLLTELNSDAVTYEVADTTPLAEIQWKAEQAAIAMIEALMND